MNRFDEYLDEVYGSFEVNGMTFSASTILKKLDPIAYDCYKCDYESFEEESHEG